MPGNAIMKAGITVTITDDNWDVEVLRSSVPVLVDFFTDACAPCRAMRPVIEALAAEYAGQAKVGILNMVDYPATAMRYRITAVPTLLLFKDGDVVAQNVGALNQTGLRRLIESYL